jgi:hypothetical protein
VGRGDGVRLKVKNNGFNFYASTDSFRTENNKHEHELWFPVDGHLTKSGNKLFGDLLFGDIKIILGS